MLLIVGPKRKRRVLIKGGKGEKEKFSYFHFGKRRRRGRRLFRGGKKKNGSLRGEKEEGAA